MRRFQGFEIAAKGAGMFRQIRWEGCEEFVEREAALRRFQPLQYMPLSRDLIVARHNGFSSLPRPYPMSPTAFGGGKVWSRLQTIGCLPSDSIPYSRGTARYTLLFVEVCVNSTD